MQHNAEKTAPSRRMIPPLLRFLGLHLILGIAIGTAFVSLIGWVALVKGLALIAVRRDFLDLAVLMAMTGPVLRAVSIGSVVIGVLLVFVSLS